MKFKRIITQEIERLFYDLHDNVCIKILNSSYLKCFQINCAENIIWTVYDIILSQQLTVQITIYCNSAKCTPSWFNQCGNTFPICGFHLFRQNDIFYSTQMQIQSTVSTLYH